MGQIIGRGSGTWPLEGEGSGPILQGQGDNSRGAVNLSPYGFPKGEGSVSAPHLKGGNNGFLLSTSTTTCLASPGIQLCLSCSAGELQVIAEEEVEKSSSALEEEAKSPAKFSTKV